MKNRERDVPVITVSNHRSLLDDPLLLSALLPVRNPVPSLVTKLYWTVNYSFG